MECWSPRRIKLFTKKSALSWSVGAQIGDESLWEEETQDGVLELRKAEASPGEGVELGEQELKP